ncbi:ankyrin [Rhizoclosmatium globosum]|uniref:Ankyrin n=1 Tax=Rhizoclosmatium globosum TaxID=329046 RepID=A0A1Y2CME3_9FUNG|nr:ankyrin [Rhizoclosmatium globosum]|eukprot:ORY48189.1 ankyrin [Rhizoclosmatium globosum]
MMYRSKSLKTVSASPTSLVPPPLPGPPRSASGASVNSDSATPKASSIQIAHKSATNVANTASGQASAISTGEKASKSLASLSMGVLSPTSPLSQTTTILRVLITHIGLTKSLRAAMCDTVWAFKKQIIEKMNSDVKDVLNFGVFVAGTAGERGHFLDDKLTIESCCLDANGMDKVTDSDANPTIKNQKKFMDDITKGNIDKVRDRLHKGFDPNFETESGGFGTPETPLCVAALQDDIELLTVLLDNGAYLDFRSSDKLHCRSAFHVAVANNKMAAVKLFIQRGAWLEIPDARGMTPMFYAVSGGHFECVSKLLELKADASYVDDSGKTLLHMACLNNADQVTGLLIDFGYLDIEAVNVAGNTPLHLTATRNAVESARRLLIRGADREKTNKFGNTALQMAVMSGIPPPPQYSPDTTPIMPRRATPSDSQANRIPEDAAVTTFDKLSVKSPPIATTSKESLFVGRTQTSKIPGPPPGLPPGVSTNNPTVVTTLPRATVTRSRSSNASSRISSTSAEHQQTNSPHSSIPPPLRERVLNNKLTRPCSTSDVMLGNRASSESVLCDRRSVTAAPPQPSVKSATRGLSKLGSQSMMSIANLSMERKLVMRSVDDSIVDVAPSAIPLIHNGDVEDMVAAIANLKELVKTGLAHNAGTIMAELDSLSSRCQVLEKDLEAAVARLG